MPPKRFESRVALSFLLALSSVTATCGVDSARAQSRGDSTLPAVPPLTGEPAPPIPDDIAASAPDAALRGARSGVALPASAAANHGAARPRVRLPKPYPPLRVNPPPPFSSKNPLPRLEPYRSSAEAKVALRLRPSQDPQLRPPAQQPPTPVAAQPTIPQKPKPKIEANPYDPIGIGIGSLRLTPFVETSYGHDSNPNRLSTTHIGSDLFRADAGFKLRTDWARDDLTADLRMGYSEYFSVPDASRLDGAGNLDARYDISHDTAIAVQGKFSIDTQRPGAPTLATGVPNVTATNRPIVFSSGAAAGPVQKFNRLEVSLRGTFERTMYEDAHYTDGSTLALSANDYNGYGGIASIAYEVTPDLKPFVEGAMDRRVHDTPVDVNGFRRDNTGAAARGGAEVKISDLVKGRVAGGYAERSYDDPRLPKLRGPTVDGEIIYTPTPLTTLTLRGATTLNETNVSNAAGVLNRSINAQLSHDLMRNLTISAVGQYFTNDYQGANLRERGYSAGVKLEYKLTRSIAIRGNYSHEHLHSSATGADYTANVYLIGLRFQQ